MASVVDNVDVVGLGWGLVIPGLLGGSLDLFIFAFALLYPRDAAQRGRLQVSFKTIIASLTGLTVTQMAVPPDGRPLHAMILDAVPADHFLNGVRVVRAVELNLVQALEDHVVLLLRLACRCLVQLLGPR